MARSASLRQALSALPFLGLIGLAVWSVAVQRGEMANAPSDRDWTEAQQIVRDGWQDGDVLRVAPYWADSARAGLFELEFNPAREMEEAELYMYERVWILADREHADDAVAELPNGWTIAERWEPNGRTDVLLLDVPEPSHVLYDMVTSIRDAQVSVQHGEARSDCSLFRRGGWHCDRIDRFLNVTPSVEETGGSLHRCLYTSPWPEQGTLRILWPEVPLGARLDGNVGNTMPAIRAERGSDVRVSLLINDQLVHEQVFGKWDTPFYPIDVDTSAWAGQTARVEATVFAEDFFDRWICLRLRALR